MEAISGNGEDIEHTVVCDSGSSASDHSDGSVMEPFEDYKVKILQLLEEIGMVEYSIEVIQHGYTFSNCVYGLTSLKATAEQYILRVSINGATRESDGRHETLEDDIVLLNYLKDNLPVSQIKAYSLTEDNPLAAAYTIQTRIPGESLNHLWSTMDHTDKYKIVDDFVDLLVKLESVKFSTAGTFTATSALPANMNDFSNDGDLTIRTFNPYPEMFAKHAKSKKDFAGSNIHAFLISHLDAWIQEEIDRDQQKLSCAIGPRFKKLQSMLDEMTSSGLLSTQNSPTVLHHWDLEPRNIMVSKTDDTYKITGIIDWDDALALPLPLSRIPPRWIWHFPDEDPDVEDGFLNDDQYADPELSEENKALRAYFDSKVEKLLPGYGDDAYGSGRWLRRIWYFAKEGAFRTWEWEFLDQLPVDWANRPRTDKAQHRTEESVSNNLLLRIWNSGKKVISNVCAR